jgi:hypothetical protein
MMRYVSRNPLLRRSCTFAKHLEQQQMRGCQAVHEVWRWQTANMCNPPSKLLPYPVLSGILQPLAVLCHAMTCQMCSSSSSSWQLMSFNCDSLL